MRRIFINVFKAFYLSLFLFLFLLFSKLPDSTLFADSTTITSEIEPVRYVYLNQWHEIYKIETNTGLGLQAQTFWINNSSKEISPSPKDKSMYNQFVYELPRNRAGVFYSSSKPSLRRPNILNRLSIDIKISYL